MHNNPSTIVITAVGDWDKNIEFMTFNGIEASTDMFFYLNCPTTSNLVNHKYLYNFYKKGDSYYLRFYALFLQPVIFCFPAMKMFKIV